MKKCVVCGDKFKPHNKTSRYCSRECYNNDRRIKAKEHICEFCGDKYEPRHKDQKYCSSDCYAEARVKQITITCPHCKKEYKARPSRLNWGKGYCSISCAQQSVQDKNPNRREVKEFKCEYCGDEFKRRVKKDEQARYCTVACSNKHYGVMKRAKNRLNKVQEM